MYVPPINLPPSSRNSGYDVLRNSSSVSLEHYVAAMAGTVAINPDVSEYIEDDTGRWRGHYQPLVIVRIF